MRIIRNCQIVEDRWRHLGDDEPIPDSGDIIVTLARWQAERDALLARNGRLGVRLAVDEPPELIADDLDHFQVVAYVFPVFRDGRPYTYARRLRERLGYTGEIRAVGDVLRDQLFFMHRCGINAMEIRPDRDIEDAIKAFSDFSVIYQPGVDEPLPLYRRHRRPWPATSPQPAGSASKS